MDITQQKTTAAYSSRRSWISHHILPLGSSLPCYLYPYPPRLHQYLAAQHLHLQHTRHRAHSTVLLPLCATMANTPSATTSVSGGIHGHCLPAPAVSPRPNLHAHWAVNANTACDTVLFAMRRALHRYPVVDGCELVTTACVRSASRASCRRARGHSCCFTSAS